MGLNGDHYKEFQEQNLILQNEEKGIICEVTCKKQRLPKNFKLKKNAIVNDFQDRKGDAVQLWDVIPDRRLQPHESMVCWERFLHLRSLKVLLVENDDSTRHIISALLRKCSYEVIEAANGLQAWKILEDISNHIDLILTEVVMPCFSGIGLLCKIMNHKTRNNIPVIMMSSHDSMGLVFKCLSKGAVDFLVKPVRKNELKILWQHVWCRCHTSSGSGSETGTQTQKSVKSKNVRNIGKNTESDDPEDNKTNFNIKDDSENGSGTQGSWTKQIVEVESSRDVSEFADSTCAQVVCSNERALDDNVPFSPTREFQEQNNRHDGIAMFDAGMIIPPTNRDFELDLSIEMDNSVSAAPNEHLKLSDIMSKAASPELNLKRLREAADCQNVTRRSESSSFSRYKAASNFVQALTVQVESNSPCEISPDIQSNSSGNPPNQSSYGYSNNVDMGSVTNNAFAKSNTMNEYSAAAPKVQGLHVLPKSKAMKEDKVSTPEQILLDNCDDMETVIVQAQSKDIKSVCDLDVRRLLNHQTLPGEHGNLSLKKTAVTLTRWGPPNLDGPIEGTASNFSFDRSGSGSNPDNNGQNGTIRPKRKGRCTRKEVHYQNRKRRIEDLDSGETRGKFPSKNAKEAGDY